MLARLLRPNVVLAAVQGRGCAFCCREKNKRKQKRVIIISHCIEILQTGPFIFYTRNATSALTTKPPTRQDTMSNWTRLCVAFEADSILDVQAIYDELSGHYRLGYAGLYACETHSSLYLQTVAIDARMSPGKVYKICKELGPLKLPQTFKHRNGSLVSEVGVFRAAGGQKGKKAVTPTGTTTMNNINRISNTVLVQICPLGQEDVSHITVQQFNKIFGNSKEEVVRKMKDELSEENYQQIVDEAWEGLQNVLFTRFFEEREAAAKPSDSESEDDSDEAPMMTPSKYMRELNVNGEPIKYDPDRSSEYNKEVKRVMATVSILERNLVEKSVSLPHEFAELLYSSPHNLNVRHPSKAGYIEYFDGKTWVKKGTNEVYRVIEHWERKAKELYLLLKEKHGAEWAGSFSERMASKVFEYSEYRHPCFAAKPLDAYIKRRALLAINNAEERVREVKRKTGKRLRRVLSESDFEARRGTVLRKTTWGHLMGR